MQKNNGKQESIQLSLFDSFSPEPPVADPVEEDKEDIVTPELDTAEEVVEEKEEIEKMEDIIPEPDIVEVLELLEEEPVCEETVIPGQEPEQEQEPEPEPDNEELKEELPVEIPPVDLIPTEEAPDNNIPNDEISVPELSYSILDSLGAEHEKRQQEDKPLTSTEELLQPMVIYFDPDNIPTDNIKEEQPIPDEPSEVLIEENIFPEPQTAIEETEVIVPALIADLKPDPVVPTTPTVPIAPITPEPENSIEDTPDPIEEEQAVMPEIAYLPSPSPDHNGKPKVLITGASGFIGGFLVKEALDRGYEVWAGIRAGSSRARLRDERIRFIDLVYDEEIRLKKQLEDFRRDHGAWNYIIHNAGITKTVDKNEFFRVNAGNTSRFIEALNAADCRPDKFMLMSSLSSYGAGDEKGFTPISLDDEQRPDTVYGMSKLEAENTVRNQDYFPYIILRPTGVYGPGDQDYFMEIKSIRSGFDFTVGMTPQRITFIYVKDLATVAFLALEKEEVKNRHYFVADGDVYTDHSFARMIQDILSKKRVIRARIPAGLVYVGCLFSETIGKLTNKSMTLNTDKYKILKQRNWICDVTPLQEDLGFVPAYSLREGLEETIAWYIDEGWL